MKLYATPLSHYSRKVRILLDLYERPYEFVDIGSVAGSEVAAFAGNPLLRVPVLEDGQHRLIESDHIAKYIVEKFDASDRYRVNGADHAQLGCRAVINGIMAEEVKLIIARRTGVPTEQYPYFAKAEQAIKNGLNWLELNADAFSISTPGYLEFHLTCLWEHLAYYQMGDLNHARLKAIVAATLNDPIIARTSPFVLKPKAASPS